MKKILTFLILVVTVTSIFGCTLKYDVPISDSLQFQYKNAKIPLTACLYISEETRKKQFNGSETFHGETHIINADIGKGLEPNAVQALNQIFEKVVLTDNKNKLPDETDIIIELSFGKNNYKAWAEGVSAYRVATIELIGSIFDSKGNKIMSDTFKGETKCIRWKCKAADATYGEDASLVAVKTLFVPFYVFTLTSKMGKIFESAINSSLGQSLDNFVRSIIIHRDNLGDKAT